MSSSTYLVIKMDSDGSLPEILFMAGSMAPELTNAMIVRGGSFEQAARDSAFGNLAVGAGSSVKVRVVAISTAYTYGMADFTITRDPSPLHYTCTTSEHD